ncbi:uncharacterized protein CLUP02_06126 [Colletotrichum lupini]|uniref:Uncharacterized protein n=1 Tax=Colletotrichum lupini TaxID=145971 RepID=A0A9Q8SQB7_9PEZI|nr:uncharacterized protein CLUP02_06126 [Colletotrichum lupini]UQC80642.1 hypothetical protein CLUP02_06126 [Colletotrichum lupini]
MYRVHRSSIFSYKVFHTLVNSDGYHDGGTGRKREGTWLLGFWDNGVTTFPKLSSSSLLPSSCQLSSNTAALPQPRTNRLSAGGERHVVRKESSVCGRPSVCPYLPHPPPAVCCGRNRKPQLALIRRRRHTSLTQLSDHLPYSILLHPPSTLPFSSSFCHTWNSVLFSLFFNIAAASQISTPPLPLFNPVQIGSATFHRDSSARPVKFGVVHEQEPPRVAERFEAPMTCR